MEVKFYVCKKCGKMIAVLKDSPCPTMCCGEAMQEVIANTTDAAQEKHVPVYEVKGNIVEVNVGSIDHPMTEEHYIEWVLLQTKQGNQRKALKPNNSPKVSFALVEGDEVVSVYAYCNLHGLWKAE
ncbi:MAG: desulfoferrodoxin Dfx [Erysipelotrichaceae bacterium]|nr:desulfoferrodoxin Dfx [Erysipelotrichaceae bacterium]